MTTTDEQVKKNLEPPTKPKFGMEEIKKTLPKIATFHSELSEMELNLPADQRANELSVAIEKLASAVTLLTKFHNDNRRRK